MRIVIGDHVYFDRLWLLPPNWSGGFDQIPSTFPQSFDLVYALIYAILITIARWALNTYVFTPVAVSSMKLDVDEPDMSSIPKNVMEQFNDYNTHKMIAEKKARKNPVLRATRKVEEAKEWKQLVKNVQSQAPGTSDSQLDSWYKQARSHHTRASKIKKFNEAAWKCTFYAAVEIYGIYIIRDKPWFHDTKQCWENFFTQDLTSDVYFYYFISLGHYIHLLFSQFVDVKRKDFWEMFIHHIATIVLIVFSYMVNFVRIGTLVLLVHDLSDVLLELAKIFVYMGWQTCCDLTFAAFALSFFICRIFIFPIYIIHTSLIEALPYHIMYPGYIFFNILLIVLYILHLNWARIILSMVISLIRTGKVAKDDRSDTEAESEADEEPIKDHKEQKQIKTETPVKPKQEPKKQK